MWAWTFMFFAFSSLYVGRVACSEFCPTIVSALKNERYNIAIRNSINNLFQELRSNYPHSDLRVEKITTIRESKKLTLNRRHSGRISLHLLNITARGFDDIRVTSMDVKSYGSWPNMSVSLDFEIPSISVMAACRLNGTWQTIKYGGIGKLLVTAEIIKSNIKIDMTLTDDRQYWKITEFKMNRNRLSYENETINFESSELDYGDLARQQDFKTEMSGKMEQMLFIELQPRIRLFLDTLLSRCPWYAVLFGKFDSLNLHA